MEEFPENMDTRRRPLRPHSERKVLEVAEATNRNEERRGNHRHRVDRVHKARQRRGATFSLLLLHEPNVRRDIKKKNIHTQKGQKRTKENVKQRPKRNLVWRENLGRRLTASPLDGSRQINRGKQWQVKEKKRNWLKKRKGRPAE